MLNVQPMDEMKKEAEMAIPAGSRRPWSAGAEHMNKASRLNIPEKVLVVGLGASGASSVMFLAGIGRKVTVTDM
jgi:hypothetical protein